MQADANLEIAASARFLDREGRTLQVIDRDGEDVLYAIRGVATFGALRASLAAFRTMVGLDRAPGLRLAWSREDSSQAHSPLPARRARLV